MAQWAACLEARLCRTRPQVLNKRVFPKIRVPYVGVLIIRILLFRVLDLDPPIFFRKPPNQQAQTNDGTLYARNPLC